VSWQGGTKQGNSKPTGNYISEHRKFVSVAAAYRQKERKAEIMAALI
jgi:hypothetical protein